MLTTAAYPPPCPTLDNTPLEVPFSLATDAVVVVPCVARYADDDHGIETHIIVRREDCVGNRIPADLLRRRLRKLWQKLRRDAPGRGVWVQLQTPDRLLTVG
jgi:hypothetical protein